MDRSSEVSEAIQQEHANVLRVADISFKLRERLCLVCGNVMHPNICDDCIVRMYNDLKGRARAN
jgi:hypothetical protein